MPNSKLELFGYNRDKVISIGQIFNKDFEPLDAARHPKEIIYMECNEPLYPNEIFKIMLKRYIINNEPLDVNISIKKEQ
ncbi:MAG: hypothetical protein L6U99_10845 [Clostridium sp.]|nr:MAG: hypothetical protein L6U99_10845 [Clostridium sp.]